MKFKILTIVFAVGVALVVFSQKNRPALAPAADFPRGAILYAQIDDLPAFVKLWNESKFKGKYAESKNFEDFKNSHLGRKLASRRTEFNEACGFPIDLEVVAGLTENRAAIALYDIGKLEFVFVAPVSDEIFALTKFVQNQDKFQPETLADGTTIYRANVEADRGRQKQELIFADVKNHFVLATSEKLMAQTLSNIEGKRGKNSLSDEPAFAALSEKIEPHVAAVWVNQTALNDDYYFRHYWLMPDGENLKKIRSGVFDLEMRGEKLVEHRKFLLDETAEVSPIENAQAAELLSFLPENLPFYRLQSASAKTVDDAVETTIFERREGETKRESSRRFYPSSFGDEDYSSNDYDNLSGKFDEIITNADEGETIERSRADVNFSKLLHSAVPRGVLTLTEPKVPAAPLFARFDRAAIFDLASPAAFNSEMFESAIARRLAEQTTISGAGVELNWESKTENAFARRDLKLPMLGTEICYALRGTELILANDADFLQAILTGQNPAKATELKTPITGLTVVNLDRRTDAYDLIFAELNKNKTGDDFFTGNISSLLDAISEVGKIEIKENRSGNFLEEELIINLK